MRPTYGKRNPSPVDMNAQAKMRDAYTLQVITPFAIDMSDKGSKSGYNDLLPSLCHEIGCSMGPRGEKEPHAMTYSSFEYGIEDDVPEFIDLRYVRLNGFNGADKTAKLSLTNPYQYKTGGFLKMWDNRSDPLNVVNLLFFYFDNHLKPAMDFHGLTDAPLFNRRAPQKELRVRFRNQFNTLSNDSFRSNIVVLFLRRNDVKQALFPSVAFTATISSERNGSTS